MDKQQGPCPFKFMFHDKRRVVKHLIVSHIFSVQNIQLWPSILQVLKHTYSENLRVYHTFTKVLPLLPRQSILVTKDQQTPETKALGFKRLLMHNTTIWIVFKYKGDINKSSGKTSHTILGTKNFSSDNIHTTVRHDTIMKKSLGLLSSNQRAGLTLGKLSKFFLFHFIIYCLL